MSHRFSTEREVRAYFAGCRDTAEKSAYWKQIGRWDWESERYIGSDPARNVLSDIDFRERQAIQDLRAEKKASRKRDLRPWGDDRDPGTIEVLAL